MSSEETTTLNEPVITSQDRERENTLAIIKPDGMQGHKEAIIQKIKENHFDIVQEREIHLSKEQVSLFYREHEGKPFYNDLTNWMSSAPVYAMVLQKENAIQEWRTLMGPTDSNKAREIAPNSIRALFGTDGSHNATHGSDGVTSAEREIDIIFGQAENKTDAKEHETSPTVIEHSNTEAAGLDLSHLNTADADSIPVDDNETPTEALVDATVPVDGHASAVNNPKEETADLPKENKQHDTTLDEEVKTEIAHTEPSSFEIDTQHVSDTQSNMDATATKNDTTEVDNSTKDETVAEATKDDDNEKEEEVVVVATLETVNADIKKDEPVEKENQAITNDQAVEETDIKEAAVTKEEEKEEKHNEVTSESAAEVIEEKKEEEKEQEQEEKVKVVVEINAETTSDDAKEEEKKTVPSQASVVEDVKTDNNKEEEDEEEEDEKQVAVEVEVAGPEVTVTIAEEKDSVEEVISEPVVEQKEESIDMKESQATDSKLVEEKQEAPAVDVSITATVTNEPEVVLQSNDVVSEAKDEHDEDDVKDENTSETVTEEGDLIDITVTKVSVVAEEDQKQQPEKEEKEAAPQEATVQETIVQDDVTDAVKEASAAEEKVSQNDISADEEVCLPQEIEQKEDAAVPPPQDETSREIATQETTKSQESKSIEVVVDEEIVIAETTTDNNNETVTEITITTAPETAIESHEIAEEALTEINLDDNKEAQTHVTETVVNEKEEEKEEEKKDKEIIQSNEDQLAEPVSVSESNNSNVTEENVISGNSSVTDVSSSDKEDKAVKRTKPKSGLRAPTKTGTVRKSATNEKVPVKAKTGGLARPSGVVKAPSVENNEKKTTTTKPARVPRVALLTKKTADVKKPEEDTKSSEKPKTTKATSTRSLVSRLTAPTAASARKKLDGDNATSEPAKKAPIKRTVPRTTTATDGIKKTTTTTTKTKASNDIKPVVKKPIAAASARVAAKPAPTDQDATKKRISRASPPTSTGTIKKSAPTTNTATNKRTTDSKIAIGSRVSGHAPKEATPKTTTKKVVTKKATKDVPATTLKKKKVASPSESAEAKPKKSEKTTSVEEEEHKIETDASTSAEIESKTEENEEETKTEASVSEEIKSEEHEEEVHEEEETHEEGETHEGEEKHEEEETHEEEQIVVTEEVEHHEEKKTEEVHIEESDAEVASITKLEVKDNSVKDRPRTPEVASIRSRFESLQHSQQLQPTNSKELRSKSPNRIADMISRFQ